MKVIKAFKAFKQNPMTKQITRSILIMSIVFLVTKSMSTGTIYADFQCDIDQANGYVERIPVIEEECKPLKWDDLSENTRGILIFSATIAVVLVLVTIIGYLGSPTIEEVPDVFKVARPRLIPMDPTGAPQNATFAVPIIEIK